MDQLFRIETVDWTGGQIKVADSALLSSSLAHLAPIGRARPLPRLSVALISMAQYTGCNAAY